MLNQTNKELDYNPNVEKLQKDIKNFGYMDYDVGYIFSQKKELSKYFLHKFQVVDSYVIQDEDEMKHLVPACDFKYAEGKRTYEIMFSYYNEDEECIEEKDFRILKEDFIYREEFKALQKGLCSSFSQIKQ